MSLDVNVFLADVLDENAEEISFPIILQNFAQGDPLGGTLAIIPFDFFQISQFNQIRFGVFDLTKKLGNVTIEIESVIMRFNGDPFLPAAPPENSPPPPPENPLAGFSESKSAP